MAEKLQLYVIDPDVGKVQAYKMLLLQRQGVLIPVDDSKSADKAIAERRRERERHEQHKRELELKNTLTAIGKIANGAAIGLMVELGVDPGSVKGTGKDGQITKVDVQKFSEAPAVNETEEKDGK